MFQTIKLWLEYIIRPTLDVVENIPNNLKMYHFFAPCHLYHAREKLRSIVLKKSSKIFSFCPIIMIQSAFKSPSLRLSNALWIICIGYFSTFLSYCDFQMVCSVVYTLQSHQNRNIFKIALFLETLFQTHIYCRIKVKSTCKEMINTNDSMCVWKVRS